MKANYLFVILATPATLSPVALANDPHVPYKATYRTTSRTTNSPGETTLERIGTGYELRTSTIE